MYTKITGLFHNSFYIVKRHSITNFMGLQESIRLPHEGLRRVNGVLKRVSDGFQGVPWVLARFRGRLIKHVCMYRKQGAVYTSKVVESLNMSDYLVSNHMKTSEIEPTILS